METSQASVEQLTKQLAADQAQVTQFQLQNNTLETMISVAEMQIKIEINKKYGSKQSRN